MKIRGVDEPAGLSLKEFSQKNKKRTLLFLGILLLVIIAAVIAAIIFFKSGMGKKNGFPFGGRPGGEMPFTLSENMTAVSGVTSVGITEEVFGVENLTTGLEIEEVYISSEDVITEGTRILKLSETSVAEARKELEKALKEADLAYRSGAIEYEQSKITAKYDLDSKILDGGQAKEIYDEDLSGLQASVDKAKEELLEAQEKIAEYQSYVNDDSYRSYFKVDEYQAIYDKTLEALKEKMNEWGVSWSQVTGQGGGMDMGDSGMNKEEAISGSGVFQNGESPEPPVSGDTVSGGDPDQNAGPGRDQIQVLASLYKVLEKQLKKWEQAQSDYENALVNASFELQTLELKLPELEEALAEAEKNYQSQVLQAKVTYEKALANADSAQSDYETALQQAETTYESLESDRKDAEENLALFESSVGDGYFYASGSGTVLRMMIRTGRKLTAESTVFMYSNPEEMTVTVSVGQEDIAGIGLEDRVYIQAGEYGGFEGVVEKVNPVSDSDSRTNVTYSVVVRFTGDTMEIPANESVTVVFGMNGEEIQNAISMAEKSMQDRDSERSRKSEGGGADGAEGGGFPSWGDGEGLQDGGFPPEGGFPQGGGFPQEGGIPQEGEGPQGENGQMETAPGRNPGNGNSGN